KKPGGIPGNDDWGSMSSWLAFAQLGFFPSNPGVNELVIAGPAFEEIILKIPGQQSISIETEFTSEDAFYIQSLYIDGQEYDGAFISQKDLLSAKKISFQMGTSPNEDWGIGGAKPYSLTKNIPSFELKDLTLDKQQVVPHEAFIITTTLSNQGTTGSYPLILEHNGVPIDTNFVLLDEKEERTIKLPLRLYRPGPHTLSINDKQVNILIEPKSLPIEKALVFSAPEIAAFIKANDRLFYQFEVQNISGESVNYVPQLFLDQQLIKSLQSIQLEPGEKKLFKGDLAPIDQLGFHEISIASSPSSRFKIYEKSLETLALHYTFEEGTDKIQDHSGFGNHGKVIEPLQFVKGVRGKGFQTQGGYIQVPESPSLIMEEEELTMLCWYQPGEEDGNGSLITKGGHNMMKMNGKWQLKLAIGGWGVGQANYNVTYNNDTKQPDWIGKWSHFVGTRADDTLKIYYNGALKSQLKVKGEIGHTNWGWRIGSNGEIPLGRIPDGILDEVMIFAKALTKEEVKEIYQSVKE
ncbi:MAG: glycoside hydrolase domain-containing protein, partial [Bacteroidota bacterium]